MNKLIWRLLIIFCIWAKYPYVDAQSIEVITLKHRLAEDIIPKIKPFMDKGGIIQGNGGNLFIKTSDENLATLLTIINKLDVPAVQFQLSVHIGRLKDGMSKGLITEYTTQESEKKDHNIRMLNGETAQIQTNQSIPVIKVIEGSVSTRDTQVYQALPFIEDIADLTRELTEKSNEIDLKSNEIDNLTQEIKNLRRNNQPLLNREQNLIQLKNDLRILNNEYQEINKTLEVYNQDKSTQEKKVSNKQYKNSNIQYEYQSLPSGIYVVPRYIHDQVELSITYKGVGFNSQESTIKENSMTTKIIINLNEWTLISQDSKNIVKSENAFKTFSTNDQSQNDQEIWVKIQKIN